ncbi:MAG: hypothetical protein JNL21_34550 [Myxococcales bacterium]|nr:hypothetical protein [Myxococcales bacterium]
MLEIICLAVISLFVFLLVARITKKGGAKRKTNAVRESAAEVWARAETARIVATKLAAEEVDVAATLGGNPDPDLVSRIEKAVQKVEVVYERVPGSTTSADIRVEVTFEDGSTERVVKRSMFGELPETVKDDFATSGAAHVFRPWLFPWQS